MSRSRTQARSSCSILGIQYSAVPRGSTGSRRAVGDHGERRLDHRERIAVRDHQRRVGERALERHELLHVLRRLQHPAARPAQPGQHLQHLAPVQVVRRLVVGLVPVAPAQRPAQPLEVVRGEVDLLQLDLLVRVVGRHLVHREHVGQ